MDKRTDVWIKVGFPGGSAGKESACKAGDPGSILGSGGAPGEGIGYPLQYSWASGLRRKESACSAGDLGSIPGLGRCPGGRRENPLQYSCLENPHDRAAWWAAVHRVSKSWARLSD